MNNEVIIIGGNHHNGLGLARILGINGIIVHSIVIDKNKNSFISKSKYVDSCYVFSDDDEAIDFVLQTYKEKLKYIIIPYSDGAAYAIDKRLNEFIGKYYVPSMFNKQGLIAKMMHKDEQYRFAKKNNIKMAETRIVEFNNISENIYDVFKDATIVKPLISSEGDKKDIRICKNSNELRTALMGFVSKGYKRALVQEYINIDYEIDVFGCVLKQKPYICQIPTRTIRSWPKKGGTNSFSQIITDKIIIEKCREIIQKLSNSGFYGLYDIELFVVNGDLILNEINYRNSGDVYMGIKQGYYYPFAWVMDCLDKPVNILPNPKKSSYAITECADVRHVIKRELNIFSWLKDLLRSDDYALFLFSDIKPTIYRYGYYLKQMILRRSL